MEADFWRLHLDLLAAAATLVAELRKPRTTGEEGLAYALALERVDQGTMRDIEAILGERGVR